MFHKKSEYHRGCLEGNDCKKLLNNVHKLKELCPPKHQNFATSYSSFNDVVSSCYGYDLKPDYKAKFSKFKQDYLRHGGDGIGTVERTDL